MARQLTFIICILLGTSVAAGAQDLPQKCEHKNADWKYKHLHGEVWRCYPNGAWKSAKQYKYGRGLGVFTEWWPTGQKKYQGPYVNGHKHGLFTHWESDGVKTSEVFWRHGKLRNMRVWDATGRLTKKHDAAKETRNYFTTFYNAKGQKTAQGESVMLKKKGKNVGFKKKGYWTYWKNGKKRYAAHQNGKRFVSVIDWWEDDGIHCQFRHARPENPNA